MMTETEPSKDPNAEELYQKMVLNEPIQIQVPEVIKETNLLDIDDDYPDINIPQAQQH
jgi:hypothetical protein